MDVPDDYKDKKQGGIIISVPNAGHIGHMMGSFGGKVVQHEIENALKDAKCPKSCCKMCPSRF